MNVIDTAVAGQREDRADALEFVLEHRKSIRAFRQTPVPDVILDRVFTMASHAPSNCNTQPWTVYLVSGKTREELQEELLKDMAEQRYSPDIPYLMDIYPPEYRERQVAHITTQQHAFGVTRDDNEGRGKLFKGNMQFWGAPHAAFFFMPTFGNEREAADVGMFAQSVMLACTALGLGSCPQTSLGLFAGPIKKLLGVDTTQKLLFGLAIGYEDEENSASRLVQTRRALSDIVRRFD